MSEITLDLTSRGVISDACESALGAADLTVRDKGAAALVRHYAALIDRAASLAEEADLLWGELDPEDEGGRKRLYKLEQALSAQSVASDLGPKLLAGLTVLGCTLAGRGVKGKEQPVAIDPQRAAHDEVGRRRAARKHHAAGADPAAG